MNPKRITKLHTCHDDFGVWKQVNRSNVHKSGSELLGPGLTHLQSSPKFFALFVWLSLSPQQWSYDTKEREPEMISNTLWTNPKSSSSKTLSPQRVSYHLIKLAELLHTQDLETSHAVREDEETRYVLP
jgi:hypothetical protein